MSSELAVKLAIGPSRICLERCTSSFRCPVTDTCWSCGAVQRCGRFAVHTDWFSNCLRRALLIHRWTSRDFTECLGNLLIDEDDVVLARADQAADDCLPSGHWCLGCIGRFKVKEAKRSVHRKHLLETFAFCGTFAYRSTSDFAPVALAVLTLV